MKFLNIKKSLQILGDQGKTSYFIEHLLVITCVFVI